MKGVRDSIIMGPNNIIISHSCDYVGTYVSVLIKFCFPRVFKQELVSLFIRVIYNIMFVAFIDKFLFLFPDYFPVYIETSIQKRIGQECIA